MRNIVLGIALLSFLSGCAVAEPTNPWTQLSLSTCKVDEFLKAHPGADGTGVVIAVLDTGVDPGIPGLTLTPDGKPKVIDVQDFTGQGDIEIVRVALEDGKIKRQGDDGVMIEYVVPATNIANAEYWYGTFEEANLVHSSVPDVNDNGTEDDEFPILVISDPNADDDAAICYVDTNLNRDFSDDKPLKSYRLQFDTLTFHRDKPEEQIEPLTFGINIFLKKKMVVLFYDDGAHGTHVAGIAAGNDINNQPGFDGVAPGAKLMGLKIGKNAVGGISVTASIKKAIDYAAQYALDHKVPVVLNMSYGVNSTREGRSSIDSYCDRKLRENPYLVFCTSGGNEGPGLSSIGTPAGSRAIISVAALMAAESARDVRGWQMDQTQVAVFSSRGGELAKPDIATPGWSTSTVPRWNRRGDFWPGTSMASPYAAGLCALLVSSQDGPVRACDVKRALQLSAEPLEGYTFLDQGYGVPNMVKAAKILGELVAKAKDDPILDYDISTPCPTGPDGTSRAAFWRSTWFPTDTEQLFTIEPVFRPGTDMKEQTGFTRRYTLESDADWCTVAQKQIYLRGEQSATVAVKYDASKLTKPGYYVASVRAISEYDGKEAFRLLNTIVVPHQAKAADNYTIKAENQKPVRWIPDRYFLAVPPGASAMTLKMTAPEGERTQASMNYLFDPDGFNDRKLNRLDTDTNVTETTWTISDDLTPGVWEADVYNRRPDEVCPYNFEARFFGLHAEPALVTDWSDQRTGANASGEVTITNVFAENAPVTTDGRIYGFRKEYDDEFTGRSDVVEHSIKLDSRFKGVRILLEMDKDSYAETTDVGVLIMDSSDNLLADSAFDHHKVEVYARNPNPGADSVTLTVKVTGGFAVEDDERETPINMKVDHVLASPVSISIDQGGDPVRYFTPGIPVDLSFECDDQLPEIPNGMRPVGYLQFKERGTDEVMLKLPIDIGA